MKISEIKAGALCQSLIHHHSGGVLRDESDLNDAKFNTAMTVKTVLEFLEDIEGTNEEKISFLKNELLELEKFKPKTN